MNCFTFIILCFGAALISAFPDTSPKQAQKDCREPWQLFHTAAEYGDEETINELLANGTDIDIKDGDNRTALYIAAKYDQPDVVKLLIENDADIDLKSSEGRAPIYIASFEGHERVVEILSESGADVNMRAKNGWTPLHASANSGNERIAKLLLINGANANYQNSDGETALFLASYLGHHNLIQTLLSYGANVNLQNNIGRTPLYGATLEGFEDIVTMLVQNGTATDVNIPDRNGSSPLHVAVDQGHEKIVEFLLKNEADAKLKNAADETPKDIADRKKNDYNFIIKILKNFHAIQIAEKACKTFLPSDRIVGGESVADDEIPWMAALESKPFLWSKVYCGGTVISRHFILTAAHCVFDKSPASLAIRLGKVSKIDGDEDNINVIKRDIENIITHPDYCPITYKNDIALIEVKNRIPFSNYVRPACLHTDLRDEPSDVKLIVSGWGQTSWEDDDNPTSLLKTQVQTMPLSECNKTLVNSDVLANETDIDVIPMTSGLIEGQYCAYDPQQKKDACMGDGGGPLQYFSNKTGTVVGIVSLNYKCARILPGVYTRVSYYLDFVVSIVWADSYNSN